MAIAYPSSAEAAAAAAEDDAGSAISTAPPVLRDLDLTIASGEKVAIVGATGSGKSTVIKLLLRHYDVGEGAITIDGVDIRDLEQQRPEALVRHGPPGRLPVHRHDRGQHRPRPRGSRSRRGGGSHGGGRPLPARAV